MGNMKKAITVKAPPIQIDIKGHKHELTRKEAEELRDKLDDVLGERKWDKWPLPDTWPTIPQNPGPFPQWPNPNLPGYPSTPTVPSPYPWTTTPPWTTWCGPAIPPQTHQSCP